MRIVVVFSAHTKEWSMQDLDWKWCPHVAAHEMTRNFLISQARLQKARQTLEAYGRAFPHQFSLALT